MSHQDSHPVTVTKQWIESFIIHYNICPFAKKEFVNDRIHYEVSACQDTEKALHCLQKEFKRLDQSPSIETSFIMFESGFQTFSDYLDLIDIAQMMLEQFGYEGIYQLATFHPDYIFAGEAADDPANFTNRSPYPMLHLIREDRLEKALKHYPNPEQIPERNIALLRGLSFDKLVKQHVSAI
ncbi:DUF1415 domain-containing protein [Algicola sagamiensis]|uniref:DUF1415 domain-containing protein n=1 Tax=Algicola sagamiensis TaxID=163869 RepID=UPI0003674E6A|nr:DUF1415 domain-containing protein [Algicola sagamiensis]